MKIYKKIIIAMSIIVSVAVGSIIIICCSEKNGSILPEDKYKEYRCTDSWATNIPPEERPIMIPENWEEFFEKFPELGDLTGGIG